MVSKKLPIALPKRALSNLDLIKYTHKLKIRKFRGVYMRNSLPEKITKNESGIINLDDKTGPGTHWTAYIKKEKNIMYFDSMGHLKPPLELIRYFQSDNCKNKIQYNIERFQKFNTFNCGHLCLKFLYVYN